MQKLLVLLNNWRSWSVIRSKIGSWQWLNIVKPSSKMFNQPTSGISPWFSSLTSVPRPYWRLTWLQAPFFPLPGAGRREIYYQPFYIWFTWFTHTAFFCSQVLQSQKNPANFFPTHQKKQRLKHAGGRGKLQQVFSLDTGVAWHITMLHPSLFQSLCRKQPFSNGSDLCTHGLEKMALRCDVSEHRLSPWMSHHQVLKIHGLCPKLSLDLFHDVQVFG